MPVKTWIKWIPVMEKHTGLTAPREEICSNMKKAREGAMWGSPCCAINQPSPCPRGTICNGQSTQHPLPGLCAEGTDLPLWRSWCAWCGHLHLIWLHLHAAVLPSSELFDGRDNRSCHYPEIKFLLSLSDMIFSFLLQLSILNIYYIPCRVTFTLERARVKLLFFKQEKIYWNKSFFFPAAATITHTHKRKKSNIKTYYS